VLWCRGKGIASKKWKIGESGQLALPGGFLGIFIAKIVSWGLQPPLGSCELERVYFLHRVSELDGAGLACGLAGL